MGFGKTFVSSSGYSLLHNKQCRIEKREKEQKKKMTKGKRGLRMNRIQLSFRKLNVWIKDRLHLLLLFQKTEVTLLRNAQGRLVSVPKVKRVLGWSLEQRLRNRIPNLENRVEQNSLLPLNENREESWRRWFDNSDLVDRCCFHPDSQCTHPHPFQVFELRCHHPVLWIRGSRAFSALFQ